MALQARDPRAVVERFLRAYNAKDVETIAQLLDPDVHLVHYGRAIDVAGRDDVVAMFARSAAGAFPDRRFTERRATLLDGERIAVEHRWEATATTDVPELGARAGEAVRMDLCTIFTVRDALIVAYDEYG